MNAAAARHGRKQLSALIQPAPATEVGERSTTQPGPAPAAQDTASAPEPVPSTAPAAADLEAGGTSPQAQPAEPQPDPDPAPVQRKRGRPRTKPAGETGTLVLWCPEGIRARMRAVQHTRGTRFLDLVLDALEDNADELDELVAGMSPQRRTGRLFEREIPREQTSDTRVQITIRGALPSHLEVIDGLVESTGASSRSALIAAALDRYLPQRPRSMR